MADLQFDDDNYNIIQNQAQNFIAPPNRVVGGLYEIGSPEWLRWVEICNYIGWNANGPLRPVKYRGFILPFNKALGVGYNIYREWRWRVNTKRPIRLAVVGEAGSGKTIMSIYLARVIEGLTQKGNDRFKVGQISFERDSYIELQSSLGPGKVIIAEETAYTMSARNWQNKSQKDSIQIVETSRYLNNPLIFPVVNRNLLDKILREYYVNYVIEMIDRGVGRIYYTWHPQFKTYESRKNKGTIYAALPGVEIARCRDEKDKPRETCLFCPALYDKKTKRHNRDCDKTIWPRYERKRDAVLHARRLKLTEKGIQDLKDESGIPKIKLKMLEAEKILDRLIGVRGKYAVGLIVYELDVNRETATPIKAFLDKHHPIVKNPREIAKKERE